MSDVETPKTILKLSYAWIVIMLTINLFYVGYILSDKNFASEDDLYNAFIQNEGYTKVTTTNLNSSFGDVTQKSVTRQGDIGNYIVDLIDGIINILGFLTYILFMFTLGGAYMSFKFWGMIGNNFLSLIVALFLTIGNIIWGVQVFRFLASRFRD